MRPKSNTKALSTIIWIILILCSLIVGALLSYIWVLGNYYAEPRNTINLVVTNVTFPKEHGDTFNITVLNTSNSIGVANITQIYVTSEGEPTIANVTDTHPEKLPIIVDRGISKTIECDANWGQLSGLPLLIHLVTPDATVTSPEIETVSVQLTVLPFFNPTISVQYFNLSMTNNVGSAINLTITDIFLNGQAVTNTSIPLPKELPPSNNTLIQCYTNWQGISQPKVIVKTKEGYSTEVTANVSGTVGLAISSVKFNLSEQSADRFNITLSNSADSVTKINVTRLVLTVENKTSYPLVLNTQVLVNQTVTTEVTWPWKNYRSKSLNMTAYTKQGYASTPKIVTTPAITVYNFTTIFDLSDTGHFKVNVTNEMCSFHPVNVTSITFSQNVTTTSPTTTVLPIGETQQFNVTWNWNSFRGLAESITVASNVTAVTQTIILPTVDLRIVAADFSGSTLIQYVNVTVENSQYSDRSVTVSQITFTVNETTYAVDGTLANPALSPNGYILGRNTLKGVLSPWNWSKYSGQNVIVTVQTIEGFTATATFLIP